MYVEFCWVTHGPTAPRGWQLFFSRSSLDWRMLRCNTTQKYLDDVSLKPDTRLFRHSGSQTCHGKEKGAGRQMQCVCRLDASFTPQYGSERALGSLEVLIPRDEESSEDDRTFPPRFLQQEIIFAHSPYEGVFHIGQAFRRIFFAHQTGSACEELLKQNTRSLRFENSLPIFGAARANSSKQESAPRRVCPCRPQCFSTKSAGSQIQCLGLGAWAEQTAPCFGRADSIYDSDSDHWKLRREADAELSQSSASAQCLPLFLLFARFRHGRV